VNASEGPTVTRRPRHSTAFCWMQPARWPPCAEFGDQCPRDSAREVGGYEVALESKRSGPAWLWVGGAWPWLVRSPNGRYGEVPGGWEGRIHTRRASILQSRRSTFVASESQHALVTEETREAAPAFRRMCRST
jgi:hypothetical protein